MAPIEKAKELVEKFIIYSNKYRLGSIVNFGPHFSEDEKNKNAKQCALIAVNEIIKANPHSNPFNTDVIPTMAYWNEVRKEIENL